jgi:hypothetical protein
MCPPNKPHLNNQLTNRDGYPITINKLTVAFSRALNLGNLLSCRKLHVNLEDYTDAPIPQPQSDNNTFEEDRTEHTHARHSDEHRS